MTSDGWEELPELLSALEDLELPRLSWGIVDGFLSEAEVRDVVEQRVVARLRAGLVEPTLDEYVEKLVVSGLLHEVRAGELPKRYRTRLAEGLRLFRRLRQLWIPKDADSAGWWRSGAPLVADYRLRVSPRRSPRRNITVAHALSQLGEGHDVDPVAASVASAILSSRNLARFQLEASISIGAALRGNRTVGRIVTAGTGSGKTLAFYLPALLELAQHREAPARTPHTLALYPRNELLRDQAREALIQARKVNQVLPNGARPIKVGVLYGATPGDASAVRRAPSAWKPTRSQDGWIAPYFPCITDGCQGDLVWSETDRAKGIERLMCSRCSTVIDESELALTRRALRASPPDILFSTTEMLSRSSTNNLSSLLGWRGKSGIRLVLLDEAHTYAGVHGAQVALMLRRWRYANGQFNSLSPVFVGLSATLKDAPDYFAQLIGVDRSDVVAIGPTDDELESTGREYGLILRGDPTSGTALLSTTIQSIMLGARLLDKVPGMFGSSAFVFTDDLDVTNRLFDNFRDAEGYFNGRKDAKPRLADLRVSSLSQEGARYEDGQAWGITEQLGRLPGGLTVGRTSSQDKGVDSAADVVIATASLEVGFNDPRVGMVVQHKSPRGMASFVQRRGRAGRNLAMRPITVVILSDYGRDRVLYQSYERLLDPDIDAQHLPIRNRYITKIQATHALIDWLERLLDSDVRGILTAPGRRNDQALKNLATAVQALLQQSSQQAALQEFIQKSLRVSPDEAVSALWDEPRSLLLSVAPTMVKQLESGWRDSTGAPIDPPRTPLPEFMTGALFDPLNSPDVIFDLPPALQGEDETSMGMLQALRETAPGRVSRRFGQRHASHRSWIELPESGSSLPLTKIVRAGQDLGQWEATDGTSYLVVRPLALKLTSPPLDVADTSAATPMWKSSLVFPEGGLTAMDFPDKTPWGALVDSCAFGLHRAGNPVAVRRMTIGSDGELLLSNGTRVPHSTRYDREGEPAALGFELEVDAFVLEGRLSRIRSADVAEFVRGPEWRTLAFRTRVEEDARFDGVANYFMRQALADIYLVAYARNGMASGAGISALSATTNGAWRDQIDDYFRAVFRSDDDGGGTAMKRADELKGLSRLDAVNAVVDEHARLLVDIEPRRMTEDLVTRATLDTLASAVLAAVHKRTQDAQDDDLVVDVISDPAHDSYRIVVSETEIGGLGLLEELQRDYSADPRRFWDTVTAVCGPSEYESVDSTMQWIVAEVANASSALAAAVARYRQATSSAELDASFESIRALFDARHGTPTHLLVSTFAARVLRPGTTAAGDQAVAYLARRWREVEAGLGLEIDARVIAFHGNASALGEGISPLNADTAFSSLWLRGPRSRNSSLDDWQPYVSQRLRERLILSSVVAETSPVVDITARDWETTYASAIAAHQVVRLVAPNADRGVMARALRIVTTLPLDGGALRLFGQVRRIDRVGEDVVATIVVAEGDQ